MSNLDLWYFAGIVFLGASFSYIVLSAFQFMGMGRKEQKSSGAGPDDGRSTQFLRHALLALAGIMIGAQLLQYHQDQKEMSKKDIGLDMAMARALNPKGAAIVGSNSSDLGGRPTSRPPRGYFSVAAAERAEAAKAGSAAAAAAAAVSRTGR